MNENKIDEKNNNKIKKVDLLAQEIIKLRCMPLLVLYYPEEGDIRDNDIESIDNEFRKFGYTKDNKIERLDILLHTKMI